MISKAFTPLLLAFAAVLAPAAVSDDGLELALPIACEPLSNCFIQSYNDNDPGPEARDFACGGATYDKHNGTDFRLLSAKAAEAGVHVVASAAGSVKAVRDGVEDVFLRNANPAKIKGKECGNGVVIDHGNGWETQYCHLKKGSVAVSRGQQVSRGDRLGHVGYSGMADFAHVHLSVRRNGSVVDPFAPDAAPGTCVAGGQKTTLWQPAAIARFGYRNGEIIGAGFTSAPPDLDKLETDHTAIAPLDVKSPVLLFYARFINLLKGDRIRILINGPGGPLIEQLSEPIDRNKATYFSYAGKKRREAPWQQGRYEARAEIIRDGAVAAAKVAEIDLLPQPGGAQPTP